VRGLCPWRLLLNGQCAGCVPGDCCVRAVSLAIVVRGAASEVGARSAGGPQQERSTASVPPGRRDRGGRLSAVDFRGSQLTSGNYRRCVRRGSPPPQSDRAGRAIRGQRSPTHHNSSLNSGPRRSSQSPITAEPPAIVLRKRNCADCVPNVGVPNIDGSVFC
jgi:hypothetical protein